jgi:hypothetical protein
LKEPQPVAVADIERLQRLPVTAVVEAAVGKRAVDVEDQEPDAPKQLGRYRLARPLWARVHRKVLASRAAL